MPNLFSAVDLKLKIIFSLERNTFCINSCATCRSSPARGGLKIVRSYFINSHFLNIWVEVAGEHIFDKPSCSGRSFSCSDGMGKFIGIKPPTFPDSRCMADFSGHSVMVVFSGQSVQ